MNALCFDLCTCLQTVTASKWLNSCCTKSSTFTRRQWKYPKKITGLTRKTTVKQLLNYILIDINQPGPVWRFNSVLHFQNAFSLLQYKYTSDIGNGPRALTAQTKRPQSRVSHLDVCGWWHFLPEVHDHAHLLTAEQHQLQIPINQMSSINDWIN